ncbi:MAG: glycerol-3-phosphate dehydrogenase/oxidase [Actinobacteria bacterium]|nr:glycerol-3-phosphate dehydrogenase/oxidase [Actinomycetota bacterium]
MTQRDPVSGLTCRTPWDARERQLERLGVELFDVLVVGGGVTGCGIALDAASRGLSTALIEKRDFAAGTSSRSSKLIHGGLRYLERFDLGLVREALHERALLATRLAPHLVHPTPFLLPLEHGVKDHLYFGAGLTLYDALAGLRPHMPRHRHLSHAACLREVPSLKPTVISGGISYYDAQVDDARFAVTLAGTASTQGACCVPAVEVEDFLLDGPTVVGVHARDLEGGDDLEIRARVVVNATGIWTTELERIAGVQTPLPVRPSKGVHIVVPRERIDSRLALILPTEKSVLFVLPWGSHWIIGTTDTPWEFGLDHPAASRADIDYLLEHANAILSRPLTTEDITAVYVGLRPLVAEDSADTAAVSREHVVRRSRPGLVSIAGGKYTTYRIMARDAVEVAARELPFTVPPSRTEDLPLLGAVGSAEAARRARLHPAAVGLSPAHVDHLARRYGTLALRVLDLAAEDHTLAEPLEGAEAYVAAEVRFAVLNEAALHVDDVLTRRTHIAFEVADRGRRAVEHVARIMAAALDWDETTTSREIDHYRSRLDAESAAQRMLDDAAADAARAPVRDVRLEHDRGDGAVHEK